MRKIICFFMAILLCASCVPLCSAGDTSTRQGHMEIPAEELWQYHVELEDFEALAQEIMTLTEDKSNLSAVEKKLEQLREWYLILNMELELSSIDSYRDVTDTQAADTYLARLDDYYAADEILGEMVPAVLDSPCEDALDRQDTVYSYYLWGYSGYGEEELELYYEEEALTDQYYSDLGQEFSVEYQGKTYTQTSADAAYINWELSYDEYDEIMLLLAMEQNDALAEYYIILAENRRLQAESYGYGDVASFYDECYYYRDITQREREELCEAVKDQIVPVLRALENKIYELYEETSYQEIVYSEQDLLSALESGLALVSSEFSEALNYMTEYGYYDIVYGENKVEGAFTTYLAYPNAPYLMMNPTGSSYDFSTIVHEFGHYNAFYCSPDPTVYNLDLAEIHSQALELLMLPQYETIFGQQAELEELNTIYAIVLSLVDGCMFDELERYAYGTEELTVEAINRKYMELLKEYGYREESDPAEEAYGWVTNSHLFGYPMYYLSYATSAAAALGIWERSLTEYERAVEDYLSLVALGETGDFYNTLEEISLEDPLDYETITHLADALEENCGLSPREVVSREYTEQDLTPVFLVLGIMAAIWLLTTILVMRWAVNKEKKRHEEYREYLYYRAYGAAEQGSGGNWGGGSPAPSAGGEAWRCESGSADDRTASADPAISAPTEDETTGSEC